MNRSNTANLLLQFLIIALFAYAVESQVADWQSQPTHWIMWRALLLAVGGAAVVCALIYISERRIKTRLPNLSEVHQNKLLPTYLEKRITFASQCYAGLRFWSFAVVLLAALLIIAAFRFIYIVAASSGDPTLAAYLAAGTGVGAFLLCAIIILSAYECLKRGGHMLNRLSSKESCDAIKGLFEMIPAGAEVIRINAGGAAFTDSLGRKWSEDIGFIGGQIGDHGIIQINSALLAPLYRTDHSGMAAFTRSLPNGIYVLILHFVETDPNTNANNSHAFGYAIQGSQPMTLDIFHEAHNTALTPVVKTHYVTVSDGRLRIDFVTIQRANLNPNQNADVNPPHPSLPAPPIISGIEILSSS